MPRTLPTAYPYLPPGGVWVEGCDVSAAQGNSIDWPRARDSASLGFAIAKSTQGVPGTPYGFVDGAFLKNRDGMRAALPFWGAYHYPILSKSPELQAQAMATVILPAISDKMLPPALDLEWTYNDGKSPGSNPFPAATASMTIDFLYRWDAEMRRLTGRRSMVYTSAGWWNSIGDPVDPIQDSYALWVANWTSGSKPLMPKGFSHYDIWQYSAESGPLADTPIDGIPGAGPTKHAVDRDRFPGTVADLSAFCIASKV